MEDITELPKRWCSWDLVEIFAEPTTNQIAFILEFDDPCRIMYKYYIQIPLIITFKICYLHCCHLPILCNATKHCNWNGFVK